MVSDWSTYCCLNTALSQRWFSAVGDTNKGLPVVVIQGSATETSRSNSSRFVDYNVGDTITATYVFGVS